MQGTNPKKKNEEEHISNFKRGEGFWDQGKVLTSDGAGAQWPWPWFGAPWLKSVAGVLLLRDHTFLHRRFLLSIGLFQELATTPIKCQLMPLRESNLIHQGTTLCCIKKTNRLVKATFTIQDLNFKQILCQMKVAFDGIALDYVITLNTFVVARNVKTSLAKA